MSSEPLRGRPLSYWLGLLRDDALWSTEWGRDTTVETLSDLGQELIPYLIQSLNDRDSEMRQRSSLILNRLLLKSSVRDKTAIPAIISGLRDTNEVVRYWCTSAIAYFDRADFDAEDIRAIVPLLEEFLCDEYHYMRDAAKSSLVHLGCASYDDADDDDEQP